MSEVNGGLWNNVQKKSDKFVVSYKNDFFDITDFRHKHPGGLNTLQSYNNRHMDGSFNEVGHSQAAIYLLNQYKIKSGDEVDLNGNICNGNVSNGISIGNLKEKPVSNGFSKEFKSDESLEHLVDWNKPMVSQIHKLGENYEEWVNLPVDRPLRLFESDFIESLTKTPWFIVPIFWIPVILTICYYGTITIPEDQNKLFVLSTRISMGIALWSIIEYTLHRYVFHLDTKSKGTPFKIFHFLLHGLHHKVPFDDKRLVFPPFPAVILACILYAPFSSLNHSFLILTGGLIGYLAYDLTHYFIHYGSPSETSYFYKLKRTHNHHHFTAHDKGYGISSSFWDNIFGTTIVLKKLKYVLKW